MTWTTLFFSDGIQIQGIGAPCLPSAEAEPAEVSPRTCGDQTVLIDFSLYDVNALHFRRKCQHLSDWTDKNQNGAYRSNGRRWAFSGHFAAQNTLPCQTSLMRCAQSVVVGRGGLEPPTSRLSGVRSNHLSYRPTVVRTVSRSGGA